MSRTVAVSTVLAGAAIGLACASDPYLAATLGCVNSATSRAQADACRAALSDAGLHATLDSVRALPRDGGAQ
jgi:hypothetical protein